jgi:hypothetical protein
LNIKYLDDINIANTKYKSNTKLIVKYQNDIKNNNECLNGKENIILKYINDEQYLKNDMLKAKITIKNLNLQNKELNISLEKIKEDYKQLKS